MVTITLQKLEQSLLDLREANDWRGVLCWSLLPVLALVAGLGLVAGKGISTAELPLDNSFNVESAFAKERQKYPGISIARVAPAVGVTLERGQVYRRVPRYCWYTAAAGAPAIVRSRSLWPPTSPTAALSPPR